jgi:hypothetical protein
MSSTISGSTRNATAAVLQVPGGNGGGCGDGGGDGGGPPPAPEGVVLPNDLGLTPAQVAPARYIRYSEATGIKLWNAASASLPTKWAVDSEGLSRFNEHVVDREMQSGWNAPGASIMMIPDVNGVLRHLIHNYGQLTPEDVAAFVTTFIGQETRQAQNDVQLYYCIANTLDERGHLRIVSEAESYTMGGTHSGIMLFKLLMRKANTDTRAAASQLRENLTNLDSYMSTIDSNIELFNQHVKVNRDGLTARGESSDDLTINLFKAYLCVTDRDFVRYMRNKKDAYDDGEDFTIEQLLTMSLIKFQILKDSGKWNSLSPEQEQIMALTSEVTHLKDHNLKFSNNAKPSKTKTFKEKPKPNGKGKKPSKKAADEEKWAWKKIPPMEGEPQSKQMPDFDKIHHWCEDHQAWVVHTPASCTVRITREEAEAAQALTAVLDGFESDE